MATNRLVRRPCGCRRARPSIGGNGGRPGPLQMAGGHGQPPPPPYAGGGEGGGNGFVPGAGPFPAPGDEPVLEVLPRYETRKPRSFWMRSRLLILIAAVWGLLFWYALSSDPLLTVHDGLVQTWNSKWWLAVLFAAELVREIHYIICEHWGAYNHFWADRVFAANRPKGRMSDWARYRAKRIFTILILIALAAVIAGAAFNTSPIQGLFLIPSKLVSLAGYIVYVVFILLLVVGQFAAIFFFLSRGGVDTYFPDDIKTRFTSVWGQDAVLEHVKESMVFLEDPESIEERGGYVPGGILLWGPPGTGKTLMAEAVAGETGKPFVFVDPGAFINMFMGVGVLKVKSVFRKLRKLALRYGGVIVFFDEADSLGNRGMMSGPGIFGPGGVRGMQQQGPWVSSDCHGGSYLSESSVSAVLNSYLMAAQAQKASIPDGRRGARDRGMMMGGMAGGGGMGTLQAMLGEMSGLKKPRGFMNRFVTAHPRDEAEAAAQVPDPHHDGDQHAQLAGRGHAAARAYRPHLPGRLPVQGRAGAHLRGLFRECKTRSHGGGHRQAGDDNALRDRGHDKGPGQRIAHRGIAQQARLDYVGRRAGSKEAEGARPARRGGIRRAGAPRRSDTRGVPRCRGLQGAQAPRDRPGYDRKGEHLPRDGLLDKTRGPFHQLAQRVRGRRNGQPGLVGRRADVLCRRLVLRRLWGPGIGYDHRTAHGGLLGHGQHDRFPRRPAGQTAWPPGPGEGEMMGGEMGKKVEERLSELLARTSDLIEQSKVDVYAVAHALESHKTLSGEDVEAVIEGKDSRGIDGRVYKVERFVEVFDDYHERIATAHVNREQVAVPLPKPVEWAPELVAEATNGNGHVAEDELEGVGPRRTPRRLADGDCLSPKRTRTYVPIPGYAAGMGRERLVPLESGALGEFCRYEA